MTQKQRSALILGLLAAIMAATRVHHFDSIPDASWAVFFVGGYYLRAWTRWAFPLLMALAVLVDYLVISGQGLDFWRHYCVSPAYWCLVAAHGVLWAGGAWLQRHDTGNAGVRIARLVGALVVSVALCHLIAQGSFYWMSPSVPDPTFAGWWKNYTDWLPPYLGVAALYVGIAAGLHVAVSQSLALGQRAARERA